MQNLALILIFTILEFENIILPGITVMAVNMEKYGKKSLIWILKSIMRQVLSTHYATTKNVQ